MRTEILKAINGGVGLLIKTLLEKAFFDKDATDMSAAGVHVKLIDGTVILVFVKLEIVFGDEATLHYVYACKGASGLKPCLVCINVFDHKTNAMSSLETGPGRRSPTLVWTKQSCSFTRRRR